MQSKNGKSDCAMTGAPAAGILIADMTGRVQSCDDGFCRLLGYDEGGIPGKDIRQLMHPEDCARADALLRQLAAGAGVPDIDVRFMRKDGSCIETRASLTLLHDANRKSPYVMMLARASTPVAGPGHAEWELLRDFVTQSPSRMAMFDTGMRYIALSKRWLDDFRLSPSDALGRSHYDLFPEIPPHLREVHSRALRGETIQSDEHQVRHAGGAVRWARGVIRPWHHPNGEIGGIVIFSEDITARKQAEQALADNQRRLQQELADNKRVRAVAALLAGHSDLGAVSHEIVENARKLMRSDAASLQEYDAGSRTMRLVSHCGFHPRSAVMWQVLDASSATPCGAALRDKRPVFFGNVGDHIDSACDLEAFRLSGIKSVLTLPLVSTGGRIAGMLSVHWKQARELADGETTTFEILAQLTADFIARVRAMADLRRSEERSRLVLRAAGAGVWFWKPDTDETVWDDRMLAIFGFRPGEQLRLESSLERIHPADRPQFEARLQEILGPGAGDEWNAEFRIVHPDGKIVWVQGLGSAFRNPDGRVAEMIGITLDISQRKAAEQELANARRLEAVGLLAASVSHDFNNLLAIISGNLELAMPRIADDAARRLAGRAAEAAKLGGSYNRRLLSSLRPSRPVVVPVDVNERAREMVKLLENVIGLNISITAKLDPALWSVSADPGEVDGALLNLAINARDAMPNGGSILIETSNVTLGAREAEALHPGARAGDYVRLSVTDNGIGMPEAVLRQVLTPFFTTKPEGAGTGLGLPSVAGFARHAGGFFSIVSAPGEGCAASIHLPRAASASSAAVRTPVPAGAAAAPMGDGELVLVVEDDDRVREVTLRRLESLGYAVEEARSGPEAVRWLEAGQPVRAVLSDIVMPGGMSGRDLANWIGANRPGIGVVLCSGYDNEGFRAGRAMAPFERIVLAKPFTREQLAVAVRHAIDRAAAQSSRTAAAST